MAATARTTPAWKTCGCPTGPPLTRSIEALLAQTLGPDKIRAEVNADLDFNQITTNTENFNPDGQVVRSTQTVEENDSSNERQQDNNVSVANNIPNPPAQQSG